MTSRYPIWLGRAALVVTAVSLLGASDGCGFDRAGALVPSYDCNATSDCTVPDTSCVEQVCAVTTASGYSVVLQIAEPDVGFTAGPAIYTYAPLSIVQTEERELVFPTPHTVYGLVRYDSGAGGIGESIEASLSFSRIEKVAGHFVDEVRADAPTSYASVPDGLPSDYAVKVAHVASHRVVVTPTTAAVPSWPSIPPALVGQPGVDVFPPVVADFVPIPTEASHRLDVVYPSSLFLPCAVGYPVMCTATGRIVSSSANGPVPEAGVRVVLESVETGLAVSTVAVTADDGTFSLRVSDARGVTRLRVGASPARKTYPTFTLPDNLFDPAIATDTVVPSFDVVRYVGRVEFDGAPVGDALVRAFSRSIVGSDGLPIAGGRFDATVRTTTDAAVDGAGFFAIELVAGDYDLVASDDTTDTSLVLQAVTVNTPAGGGPQAGQTFVLGNAVHLAGSIAGPDGRTLPYASVEALPVLPPVRESVPTAYARLASSTSDLGGAFDLAVDSGLYDLVFSLPAANGLPVLVVPAVPIASVGTPTWFPVTIPPPVVIYGTVRANDGSVVPRARVSAFLFVAPDAGRLDAAIALGDTLADEDGHYRILLPSEIIAP